MWVHLEFVSLSNVLLATYSTKGRAEEAARGETLLSHTYGTAVAKKANIYDVCLRWVQCGQQIYYATYYASAGNGASVVMRSLFL